VSDRDSPIRYVIRRRVGDFDEYLQEDGMFGNLTDHSNGRNYNKRRDVTRVFNEREHAELFREKWSRNHPMTSEAVPLEIWRLP
jgi:hypothetical protein